MSFKSRESGKIKVENNVRTWESFTHLHFWQEGMAYGDIQTSTLDISEIVEGAPYNGNISYISLSYNLKAQVGDVTTYSSLFTSLGRWDIYFNKIN